MIQNDNIAVMFRVSLSADLSEAFFEMKNRRKPDSESTAGRLSSGRGSLLCPQTRKLQKKKKRLIICWRGAVYLRCHLGATRAECRWKEPTADEPRLANCTRKPEQLEKNNSRRRGSPIVLSRRASLRHASRNGRRRHCVKRRCARSAIQGRLHLPTNY